MKPLTKKWVEIGRRDLGDADILFGNKRYFGAVYYCHQAVEKFLKALICEKGKKIKKTHDLSLLLSQSEVKYTKEILEFINELNPYYNPIRYPDAFGLGSFNLNFRKTKRILKLTKEVIKWLKYHLK